jgi:hypothetical protein
VTQRRRKNSGVILRVDMRVGRATKHYLSDDKVEEYYKDLSVDSDDDIALMAFMGCRARFKPSVSPIKLTFGPNLNSSSHQ